MSFYSLFIKQTDGSYYPIPIQVWNQQNSRRLFPNQGAAQNDY